MGKVELPVVEEFQDNQDVETMFKRSIPTVLTSRLNRPFRKLSFALPEPSTQPPKHRTPTGTITDTETFLSHVGLSSRPPPESPTITADTSFARDSSKHSLKQEMEKGMLQKTAGGGVARRPPGQRRRTSSRNRMSSIVGALSPSPTHGSASPKSLPDEFELSAPEVHELEMAVARCRADVDDAVGLNNKKMEGEALGRLGNAYRALGEYKKALEIHKMDKSLASQTHDKLGEGKALGNMGNVFFCMGDLVTALEVHHNRHLPLVTGEHDRAGQARAFGSLGVVYSSLRCFEEAVQMLKRQLELSREEGDVIGEQTALLNLTRTMARMGRGPEAEDMRRQAMRVRCKAAVATQDRTSIERLIQAGVPISLFKS